MKTSIVLCFCVVHSLSAYHAHGTKTCCGPIKWQGVVLQTIGTYSRTQDFASLAYATSRVYYDYDNKLVAIKERRLNETAGITTDTWKIMKYSEATSYIIENGRCQRLQLAEKMPSQCIPDQAVSLGTHKYPGFDANVWFVKDNNTGRATRYGVTIDSCMFLTESYITKGPVWDGRIKSCRDATFTVSYNKSHATEYSYVSSLYENMTQTIDDPSVFVPPSFCPRASDTIRAISRKLARRLLNNTKAKSARPPTSALHQSRPSSARSIARVKGTLNVEAAQQALRAEYMPSFNGFWRQKERLCAYVRISLAVSLHITDNDAMFTSSFSHIPV